jgi:glycosyltransferase involved in cell wall biosynthesis
MGDSKEHISICICTFKRPDMLLRTLNSLRSQRTDGLFTYSIVVADNDRAESAKSTVEAFAASSGIETKYCMEPTPNIALARNAVVRNAHGDYLAFIDDDEFPNDDWLLAMLKACKAHDVAGVLAPVLPHFETEPPAWLKRGGFYDRPRHKTGYAMSWEKSRTGNVLLRRKIIEGLDPVFTPAFGAGGEDLDFFRRMNAAGHKFIWCDEAPAYETVPQHRWTRRFLIRRALLRGQQTFRHPKNRWKNIAKSLVAAPLYLIALPFLLVAGQHHFMRYLVRMCDHGGRLLAMLRLNPVSERNN